MTRKLDERTTTRTPRSAAHLVDDLGALRRRPQGSTARVQSAGHSKSIPNAPSSPGKRMSTAGTNKLTPKVTKSQRIGTSSGSKIKESAIARISRQWHLLQLIPTYPAPPIKTSDLAERLAPHHNGTLRNGDLADRFLRMVQHDVRKLGAAIPEIDVSAEIDSGTGYLTNKISWKRDAPRLTLRGMNWDEQIAFGVLEKTGVELLPRTSMKALKPYFDEARGPNNSWAKKIVVEPETLRFERPQIKPTVESVVYSALHQDVSIKIDYKGSSGSEHRGLCIRPLALVRQNVRTYLIANEEHKQTPRTFALHRILRATETFVDVPRPANFNLDKYLAQGIAHPVFKEETVRYGDDIHLRLWVHSDTAWLRETPLSRDQEFMELPDHHFDLRATVPLSEPLVRWLLSMAYHVKVLAPEFLAQRIRDDAARMRKLYATL